MIDNLIDEVDRCIEGEPAKEHPERSDKNVDYGVELPGEGQVEGRLSHLVRFAFLLVDCYGGVHYSSASKVDEVHGDRELTAVQARYLKSGWEFSLGRVSACIGL